MTRDQRRAFSEMLRIFAMELHVGAAVEIYSIADDIYYTGAISSDKYYSDKAMLIISCAKRMLGAAD